jgi:hypothetical protein
VRVLVTGSRNWLWSAPIFAALDERAKACSPTDTLTVVHGDAAGADRIADIWARTRADIGWPIIAEPHPADWSGLSRRAGIVRNRQMVALGADVCLAFIRADSKGATNCAITAADAGIPTVITPWESQPWTLRDLVDEPYLNRHTVIAEAKLLGVVLERTAPYALPVGDVLDNLPTMVVGAAARWRAHPTRHKAVMTIGANPRPETLDAAYVLAEVAALRRMAAESAHATDPSFPVDL